MFAHYIFIIKEKLRELERDTNNLDAISDTNNLDAISKATSFSYAIESSADSLTLIQNLPDFPSDNLKLIARISDANPEATAFDLIYRLYPFESFLPKESLDSVKTLLKELRIDATKPNTEQKIIDVMGPTLSEVHINSDNNAVRVYIYTGKSFSHHLNLLFTCNVRILYIRFSSCHHLIRLM